MSGAGAVLGGRYRLESEIGAGGMGTVWRAMDLRTEREVAVKQLRPEFLQDPKLRRRLRREARAVARLEHPNIVRLYDMGEDEGGSPFLAMEMVRGRSLSRAMEDGLELGQLAELVDQILGALAFAHARGVIHRDLKPDNIVISAGEQGQELVKLLDFGFARVEDDSDQDLTQVAKDVFGTPTYMAPEQATGDYEVSDATDLYAIGIVLWELLTGDPPFQGKSGTAIVVQHVTRELPPFEPLSRYGEMPGIEALLARALEKEPARRFGSAGEMRRALTAVFDEEDEDWQTVVVAAPTFDQVSTDTRLPVLALDPSPTPSPKIGKGPAPAAADEVPLVGRDDVARWLWEQVVEVCRASQGIAVVLEGAVGVGKSRLVDWLRQALTEGGWMTPAGGVYRVGSPTAGGFRAALRTALGVAKPGGAGREQLRATMADLDPDGRVSVEVLGDWLWPDDGRPPLPAGRVVALVEPVLRMAAARRPVMLWLDDLQHGTSAELAVFEHLVHNLGLRPAPVLLVATRRTDEVGFSMAATEGDRISSLLQRRNELVAVRRLDPLGPDAMAALIQSVMPVDGAVTQSVMRAARGVPLYAHQALHYLYEVGDVTYSRRQYHFTREAEPLPPGIVDLMSSRLGRSLQGHDDGDALAELVENLALLGDQFDFGLAETAARRFGIDVVRLETGLDALARLGVLVDQAGDAFAFAHGVMREALLRAISQRTNAQDLHARVAEAKTSWYASGLGPAAADIAHHHLAAGNLAAAVDLLLVAATDARASFHYESAEALYAEADRWLSNAPGSERAGPLRADVFRGLAEIALEVGDVERAQRLAAQIERWARATADQRRLAGALRIQGEALVHAGKAEPGEQMLAEAASLYESHGDALGLAQAGLARGRAAMLLGKADGARTRFEAAAEAFRTVGDARGEAGSKRALAELALRGGDRTTAAALFAEVAETAVAENDQNLLAQAAWRLGEMARQAGQLESAEGRYRQAVDAYDAIGNASGVGRALRGLADTQRIRQSSEAAATYLRAVTLFQEMEDVFQLGICHTQLGRLWTDANELEKAEGSLEQALECLEQFDDPVRLGVIHGYLARIAHRRGDHRTRDARLEAALRIDGARPLIVGEWPLVLEEIAEGASRDGDHGRARVLAMRAAEVWTALRRTDRAERVRHWAERLG